jgi:hypothetical protein
MGFLNLWVFGSQITSGHRVGEGIAAMVRPPARKSLSEAAWHFGPARLRRQLEDAAHMAKGQSGRQDEPGDRIQEALTLIGKSLEGISAWTTARDALREHLLQKLRDRKLVAMGYPVHREDANQREEPPEFLFQQAYTEWSECVLKGSGRRFESVEVFKPHSAPIQLDVRVAVPPPRAPKQPPKEKQSVGRPNVRDKVTKIALLLFDSDKPPKWRFRKELYPLIREIGKQIYKDDFGDHNPKDEVMRIGVVKALRLRPHIRPAHKL